MFTLLSDDISPVALNRISSLQAGAFVNTTLLVPVTVGQGFSCAFVIIEANSSAVRNVKNFIDLIF